MSQSATANQRPDETRVESELRGLTFSTSATYLSNWHVVMRQQQLGLIARAESFEQAAAQLQALVGEYTVIVSEHPTFFKHTDQAHHWRYLERLAEITAEERRQILIPPELFLPMIRPLARYGPFALKAANGRPLDQWEILTPAGPITVSKMRGGWTLSHQRDKPPWAGWRRLSAAFFISKEAAVEALAEVIEADGHETAQGADDSHG